MTSTVDGTTGPWIVYSAVALAIVGSSLLSRRVPWRRAMAYTVAWVGIFGVVYGLVLFRGELGDVARRADADLTGAAAPRVSGRATFVSMRGDGHFWVEARVGSEPVDFLIDSGASVTALDAQTARRLHIDVDRSGLPTVVDTANGPIRAWPATVPTLRIGSIIMHGVPVLVSDAPDHINLLGMSWLSALSGWSVQGRTMRLDP